MFPKLLRSLPSWFAKDPPDFSLSRCQVPEHLSSLSHSAFLPHPRGCVSNSFSAVLATLISDFLSFRVNYYNALYLGIRALGETKAGSVIFY